MLTDTYFREGNAVFVRSRREDIKPMLMCVGTDAVTTQSIVDTLNRWYVNTIENPDAIPQPIKLTQENLDAANRALANLDNQSGQPRPLFAKGGWIQPPAAMTDPRNVLGKMTMRQDMEEGDRLTHAVTGKPVNADDRVAALEHQLRDQRDATRAAAGHARAVDQKVQAVQHELGQRIESVALSLSQLRSATGSTFESIGEDQEEDRRRIGETREYLTNLYEWLHAALGDHRVDDDIPTPPWPTGPEQE